MQLSRLTIALLLPLSGCGVTENMMLEVPAQLRALPVLGLAPAPVQPDRTVAKPRITRPPKPEPIVVRVPELSLPPWSIPAEKPSRTLRYTLPPSELFRRLSQSVYTVTVPGQTAKPESQGSAVAISTRELITNCHVVAHGRAVTLLNGDRILRAEMVAADVATDRCWLRADGELQPVPGIREYDTLMVGETVYTIGSPKGLGNTLGQGILSGLRTAEDKTQFVQVTAPVSPGSSGGGLFDDRGNLIGVVTFTIRDAQNLNFAISASQFWKAATLAAAQP
jgi:serine protease Do